MAAVIGSRGLYNRDPLKMTRYHAAHDKFTLENAGSMVESNESGFWGANMHSARITTNAVANTARTIVSISDKAGFFTFAMSSKTTETVEFVVTIDGVATTITDLIHSEGGIDVRTCIGAFSGWTTDHQSLFSSGHSAGAYTVPAAPLDSSRTNATNYSTPFYLAVPDPTYAIANQPSNVVRFEKSLIVTVKTADAQSSGTDGYAAVHYILDAV